MKKSVFSVAVIVFCIFGYFIFHETKFSEDDIVLELAEREYLEYGETFDLMSLVKHSSGEVQCEIIDQYKLGKQQICFVVEEKGLTKKFVYEVEVRDTQKPQISFVKNQVNLKYGQQYDFLQNIKSVNDVVDGDIQYKKNADKNDVNYYTVESDVDWKKAGNYEVRVIAVDKNHNRSEKSFQIRVEEKKQESHYSTTKPSYTAKDNHRIIVIDPGHQGHGNNDQETIGPGSSMMKAKVSSGATGVASKIPESKTNLEIGLKLQNELQARGYTVVMTRTSQNVNMSNQQRAKIGNQKNADAVIHLHCDGGPSNVKGAHTIAIAQDNPYCSQLYKPSAELAKNVIQAYCRETGIKNRGVSYRNDLTGLNWSQVPSIYIEMGFISNQCEDLLLTDHAFQEKCAKGIADGIDQYFQ